MRLSSASRTIHVHSSPYSGLGRSCFASHATVFWRLPKQLRPFRGGRRSHLVFRLCRRNSVACSLAPADNSKNSTTERLRQQTTGVQTKDRRGRSARSCSFYTPAYLYAGAGAYQPAWLHPTLRSHDYWAGPQRDRAGGTRSSTMGVGFAEEGADVSLRHVCSVAKALCRNGLGRFIDPATQRGLG